MELCGRSINVGRPKGYVEPPGGPVPAAQPVAQYPAGAAAAVTPSEPQTTINLLLESLLKVKELRDEEERSDIMEDVKEECNKVAALWKHRTHLLLLKMSVPFAGWTPGCLHSMPSAPCSHSR